MSWNEKFRVKQETTDSSYNTKVAGGSGMKSGKHEGVTLSAVTPVESDKYHAYDLIWENKEGETFKERHFVTYETRDSEGRVTGDRDISDAFVKLGVALCGGDNLLNQQYFLEERNGAYINADRMKAAIGTKVTLIIGLPKKGFTVKNTDSGMVIVDIESGEPVEGFETFAEFSDIKEFAKEQKIKLAYNQVRAHRTFKDAAATNRQQIQAVLDASAPKGKIKAATGF